MKGEIWKIIERTKRDLAKRNKMGKQQLEAKRSELGKQCSERYSSSNGTRTRL